MVFNIGKQDAGVINNVQGDQTVHGGQQGVLAAGDQQARDLVDQLREALRQLPLPPDVAPQVHGELEALDTDLAQPEPDKRRAADRLTRITRLLASAGALVASATGLLTPLSALAGWLGVLGEPILRLLDH
ncbi:hypothetical protein ACWC0C_15655 [Streptomyces sp. NPDC001709]